VKISADADEPNAINTILARTTDQRETLEEKGQQSRQDIYMEDHTVRRSNSVSKITQHFKTLQEKANASIVENKSQRVAPLGIAKSYGIQRYRERKTQSGERFSTQPVTFQEVREAVLQNQRNVALNGTTDDDLIDPSKLSLTERVRLFNQKIATTETEATNATYQERLIQKRRSVTRYKTQPVTSEEVEVASQISPLNVMNYQMLFGGKYWFGTVFFFILIDFRQVIFIVSDSKECQKATYSLSSITIPHHDLPKSILKSSASYTQNMPRAKSPELRGIKLIKSVLKRESEESEQSTILSSTGLEIYPRSILKSNSQLRSIQTANVTDTATSKNEVSMCGTEVQNLNSEIIKPCEKLNNSNVVTNTTKHTLQCLYDVEQIITCKEGGIIEKEGGIIEKKATVPLNNKTTISQNEKILLLDNVDNCRINTILASVSKEHDDKCDDSLADKSECMLDNKDNDTNTEKKNKEEKAERKEKDVEVEQSNDDSDDNDHASSSSGGQEIHDIVSEKHASIIQYPANSLAKSISQHSLSDEKQKRQCGLPLPGLCRSTTQMIKSIEMSEMPSVSIADRLAALRHNGSTNWRRRIVEGKNDESCNDSPFNSEENMAIKSGVLADCMEKLESAVENWKNRIVTPDAINFTIAGKMKMTQSKDPSSLFLTEYSMTNTPNQKKKIPRWFKTKKDKGEIFHNRIITKKI